MSYIQSLQNKLHKQVPLILQQTFANYKRERGYLDEKEDEELLKKLEKEKVRLIPMVDQSIAKERVERTKKTFFITGGVGVGLAIFLALFTGGLSLFTLLAPLVTASGAAYASVKTVNGSYQSRIRGGFDSVIALHRHEVAEKKLAERKTSGGSEIGHKQSLEEVKVVSPTVKNEVKRVNKLQKPENENRLSHIQSYRSRKGSILGLASV